MEEAILWGWEINKKHIIQEDDEILNKGRAGESENEMDAKDFKGEMGQVLPTQRGW